MSWMSGLIGGIFLAGWLFLFYQIMSIWILLLSEQVGPVWQRLTGLNAWARIVSGDESGLSREGAKRFQVLRKRFGYCALGIAAVFIVFAIVDPT